MSLENLAIDHAAALGLCSSNPRARTYVSYVSGHFILVDNFLHISQLEFLKAFLIKYQNVKTMTRKTLLRQVGKSDFSNSISVKNE